jgi:hypothetical protein
VGEGEQGARYVELEQREVVVVRPELPEVLDHLVADDRPGLAVCLFAGAAGDRETVVLAGRREHLGVERVAAVAAQVPALRAGEDEHVQARGADDRAYGVDPGTAVAADRGEETQADVVLVELRAADRGQRGLLPFELCPGEHGADVTEVSLTSAVSVCL